MRKKKNPKPVINKKLQMKAPSIHRFLSLFHFIKVNGIYTLLMPPFSGLG